MTDERSALGARMAEAMGWEKISRHGWQTPEGKHYFEGDLLSWPGYGIVDAWMREQGYDKEVIRLGYHIDVKYSWDGWPTCGNADDEPFVAIQAALAALEARE